MPYDALINTAISTMFSRQGPGLLSKPIEFSKSAGIFALPLSLLPSCDRKKMFVGRKERNFATTASAKSKLGRTPVSIPQGVEFTLSEPKVKHDPTSYLRIARRTATIKGPLGTITITIEES